MRKRGIKGVDITAAEFFFASNLAQKYVKLSGYDRIALAIAKIRNYPLLTGDKPLRNAAEKEGVQVLGTIGILDKLYEEEYVNRYEYKYCLESLLEHKERRLPESEIQKRLDRLED